MLQYRFLVCDVTERGHRSVTYRVEATAEENARMPLVVEGAMQGEVNQRAASVTFSLNEGRFKGALFRVNHWQGACPATGTIIDDTVEG